MKEESWYHIHNVATVDSPQLLVYADRVKQNIRQAAGMIGDVERLRPHIKTVKSAGAIRLMREAGIRKFKCATIAEAELLARQKVPDILLAYQPVGPKAERFTRLFIEYPDSAFSCLVDDSDAAEYLSDLAAAEGLRVPVYMDLNVGMNRTGISPDTAAIALYKKLERLPGIGLVGLHAYDGHIHMADFEERKRRCDEAFALVDHLRKALIATGAGPLVIVAGGSPTFPFHLQREGVECSPGTFPYWDKGYGDAFAEQNFLPAALVLTRVISLPEPDLICLDLGHKSVAPENVLARRLAFLNLSEYELVGQSEEHLTVRVHENHGYKTGDVFYALPGHICPTVALYERAVIIENQHVTAYWLNEARDRKITI
ncbi:MAG: D-TA family PLP-dependent enzyme [Mucilaginibacter polytrichastri]|nr:D-TA family PLP-dependent enzyme [Mucilaginibacter polytrichastri]